MCGTVSIKFVAGWTAGAAQTFAIREGGRTVGAGTVTALLD
jgi:translation elongation factor EF-Tu-like GTPase